MAEWPDPLVVMALEIEGQGEFERAGIPVLYTGVGKITNLPRAAAGFLELYRSRAGVRP